MKKIISIILSLALLLSISVALTACDDDSVSYVFSGKTTYFVGDAFDADATVQKIKNGKVKKSYPVTADMVSGFSTETTNGNTAFTVEVQKETVEVAYYVCEHATALPSEPTSVDGNVNVYKDLLYGNDTDQEFDVYLPSTLETLNADAPVFLYVHGGAWMAGLGSKDIEGTSLMGKLATQGFVAFTMNYELQNFIGTGASFDDMQSDIGIMVAYMKDLLPKMGLNATKIAIGGVSAGGHLSSLYAYKAKNSPLEIAFEVDIVGPTQLSDPDYQTAIETLLHAEEGENEVTVMGTTVDLGVIVQSFLPKIASGFLGLDYTLDLSGDDLSAVWTMLDEYAPVLFINEQTCPTILAYGRATTVSELFPVAIFPEGIENDMLVPVSCYRKMKENLTANNVYFVDKLFEGVNHVEMAMDDPALDWVTEQTVAFADLYL